MIMLSDGTFLCSVCGASFKDANACALHERVCDDGIEYWYGVFSVFPDKHQKLVVRTIRISDLKQAYICFQDSLCVGSSGTISVRGFANKSDFTEDEFKAALRKHAYQTIKNLVDVANYALSETELAAEADTDAEADTILNGGLMHKLSNDN